MDNVFASEVRATLIEGAAGTGKTHELVARAAALLDAGTAPADVLVVCATPQAARAFSRRLAAAAGEPGAAVRTTTARALALEVLARPDAVAWTGRDARLLTDYEEKFLMEDMKVSGLRIKRLREMLKFFYRSWTELADDDPTWLLAGEESDVHGMLKGNLALTRSVLEPEAANLAVNYLRTHEGACEACRASWVLVDDYQCLSRASQQLANLVARTGIVAAADRAACVEVHDSYPYAAGIDEFLAAHAEAEHVTLTACHRSHASLRAAQALLADESMGEAGAATGAALTAAEGAAEGPARVVAAHSPAEEFQAVAQAAADAITAGTPAHEVTVAVPNGTWARNVAAALRAAGVRAAVLPAGQPVRGDIRDNERCRAARILTALDLVADEHNALAWRCWCGYGDYLVNSAAISSLRALADERGCGLVDALSAIAGGTDAASYETAEHAVGAQRVTAAYAAGRKLLAACNGLSGRALLDAIAHAVTGEESAPAQVVELCLADGSATAGGEADDSAAAMARRFRERLLAPVIADDDAVAVVPYDLMAGLSPDTLIIAGFVNGFIPTRDYFDTTVTTLDKQEKIHAADVRRVYALASKANRALTVSYFTSTDLESAGVLKLKIDRIRLEKGVRTCAISPSDFLAQVAVE